MLSDEDLQQIKELLEDKLDPITEDVKQIHAQRTEICRKLAEIDLRVKDLET